MIEELPIKAPSPTEIKASQIVEKFFSNTPSHSFQFSSITQERSGQIVKLEIECANALGTDRDDNVEQARALGKEIEKIVREMAIAKNKNPAITWVEKCIFVHEQPQNIKLEIDIPRRIYLAAKEAFEDQQKAK